jgi:hypothetical protein
VISDLDAALKEVVSKHVVAPGATTAFLRTGSTARGDFAIDPAGRLTSDVEYLLIALRRQGALDCVEEAIRQVLGNCDEIPAEKIQFTASRSLGALFRRRAYFFADAISSGIWFWGEHWKRLLNAHSLSPHFTNFTLLVRLRELASARRSLLDGIGEWETAYTIAKVARHFGGMLSYRNGLRLATPAGRIAHFKKSRARLERLLLPELVWAERVYSGRSHNESLQSLSAHVRSLVTFASEYISRERCQRARWPIGHAWLLERVRHNWRGGGLPLIRLLSDSSYGYRVLADDYLEALLTDRWAQLDDLKFRFETLVGEL